MDTEDAPGIGIGTVDLHMIACSGADKDLDSALAMYGNARLEEPCPPDVEQKITMLHLGK